MTPLFLGEINIGVTLMAKKLSKDERIKTLEQIVKIKDKDERIKRINNLYSWSKKR